MKKFKSHNQPFRRGKKYEVLPRQEKDMRGCCFCIKNANCQKKRKYAVPG